MKNKKFLRAIATLTVGAVAAAGCVSLTACGHKHSWGDYKADGATGHYQLCTGCDEHSDTTPHDMEGNECKVCHWTSSGSSVVAVTGVTLNKKTLTLKEGANETLTATVAPADATNKAVSWSSDKPSIATVENGKVTAVAEGTAVITVKTADGNKTDTCTVTVTKDGTVTPPVELDDVLLNVSTDITASTTDGQELADGIKSVGALARSSSTRTVTYPGLGENGKLQVANRLQFGKNLGSEPNGLEITPKENATLIVYASGSNADTEGFLGLYSAKDAAIGEYIAETKLSIGKGGSSDIGTVMYQLTKGTTYYLARSEAKTVNLFFIALCYKPLNEVKTEVPETAATCETPGNAKYYTTNYGRYLAADGVTHKVAHEVVNTAAALGHSYTVNVTKVPDETQPGTAELTCGRDSAHNKTVNLPVLSSNDYIERPAAGESGTYKIVVDKVEITFTANGVGAAELTYTTVYGNNFATAGDVVYGADAATSAVGTSGTATAKIYGSVTGKAGTDQAGANAFTDNNKVVIADNLLKTVDASSNITTDAYVILDNALSSGIIKISCKITLTANKGSWTPLQILNGNGEEFIGFRTPTAGQMGYRLDGGTATGNVAFTANTEIAVEIILDFSVDTPTAVISFNGTKFDKVNLGAKAAFGLGGIRLTTSNNANRNIFLGDLVIATQD